MPQWAYFDTSAVVKLYVREPGSADARRLIRSHKPVSSFILPLEVFSALSRRRAEGTLAEAAFGKAVDFFRRDLRFFDQLQLTGEVRARAEAALLHRPIRTLDAIHISSALVFRDDLQLSRLPFVTGDRKQKIGADQLGLETVWVGDPL